MAAEVSSLTHKPWSVSIQMAPADTMGEPFTTSGCAVSE